jgi:hypothetical protein
MRLPEASCARWTAGARQVRRLPSQARSVDCPRSGRGEGRLALLLLGCSLAVFPLGDARADPTALRIPRVSGAPSLDGLLNGPTASDESAGGIADFRQREPGDGVPSSLQTRASVSYDEENLYVLFVCQDDPKKTRAHLGKREAISGDDQVLVYLDTFRDGQRAYLFASNPLGVQLDGIVTEGQDDDYSFDTLWYSAGKLTADGYMVLMTIPFRSLRFPDTPTQSWKVALGRVIPRNNEESYWPYITKRVQGFIPQFATASGLEGISPGRNIQFIPYGISTRARFLETTAEVPAFRNQDEFRGGLDSKVVLHDAYALDVALNPDFSQVESDEPQATINQRFEVVFPERRPFFVENAGFFQTPTSLFFSRRIADPQYGFRLSGKAGRWAMGALAADDRAPGRRLEPTEPLRGRRAIDGVVSVQREFGASSAGLLATSRDFGPGFNRAFSLHSRLKLSPTWFLSTQALHGTTKLLDGKRLAGPGLFVELNRDGRAFDYVARYTDLSPEFRAQLGYVKRVDIRQFEQMAEYRWRPDRSRLVKFGPTLTTLFNRDHQGRVQDGRVEGEFKLEFTGQTELSVVRSEAFERFEGLGFRKHATAFAFSTEWLKWLGFSTSYSHGTEINFDPAPGLSPFLANAREANLTLTLLPSPRVRLDQTWIYSRLNATSSFSLPSDSVSSRIFENTIVRWKLNYQFTRPLSLRAIVDYETVIPNPSLVDVEHEKRLAGDLLVTYLLNPGTALYVGYANRRENQAIDPTTPPTLRRTDSIDMSTGRQFFVKVSYLIRR